jgi:hypothetical protein
VADRRVTYAPVETTTGVTNGPPTRGWRESVERLPWWAVALAIFAASRVVTTVLFLWVRSQATPSVLPLTSSGAVDTNQWAFLPVYPYLAKALSFGVLDWRIPALAVSIAAGFGAAVLLGALLLPHLGRSRTLFSVAVFSVSPLAFVFQTTYAEPLALLMLLAALLLIDREQYLPAVPVALVLAFTRPGILALALAVGLQLLIRMVRAARGGPPLPAAQLGAGILLAAVCTAAGFAWTGIAALATGRADAYFATEGAWRALWMPDGSITFFYPWWFAAEFWAERIAGPDAGPWIAPLLLVVVLAGFTALLVSPQARRLGTPIRLWALSYALYLLAVFFPQSSTFRLLMPMAPLAGAITPRSTSARVGVLAVCVALQALWLWVCYGPVQDFWTVP